MILTDQSILDYRAQWHIVIEPFYPECLWSNSYDAHLSKHIAYYIDDVIDTRRENTLVYEEIPDEGMILYPNHLYLWSTIEYTETYLHVPYIEWKSSTGRAGISIHATAGKWDIGFQWHRTLEISVTHPVRVYHSMPIAQFIYHSVEGTCNHPYHTKSHAKYHNQGHKPIGTHMHKNYNHDPLRRERIS